MTHMLARKAPTRQHVKEEAADTPEPVKGSATPLRGSSWQLFTCLRQ